MKKRLTILTFALLLATVAQAQIFIEDGEYNSSRAGDAEALPGLYIDNTNGYGSGEDWYTPLGSGILLLTALGGAYLLGKKPKKENK